MRRGRPVALLLWALAAARGVPAPVLLNASHFGPVSHLAYDAQRGILVSGGEDGGVRVWSLTERRLLAAVQVSHRPVRSVALHPREPQFAALVGEGLRIDTLSCWDWERGRELFRVESDAQLLHAAYSPLGSYLFYSRAAYDSLVALEPGTGRSLPFLARGFGIVSYFTIARNDTNILTYQPSGTLAYWEIRSGKNLRQLQTLPGLEGIEISGNNRFAAAVSGDELVVVDLLSGEPSARARAVGLAALALSADGNQVTAIGADASYASDALRETGASGTRALRRWYFNGKSLLELAPLVVDAAADPRCLAAVDAGLVVGEADGKIRVISAGQASLLAEDLRLRIYDLAFSGSRAAAAVEGRVLLFEAPLFSPARDVPAGAGLSAQRSFETGIAGPVGVEFLDERRLLISSRGEGAGRVSVLDTASGVRTPVSLPLSSPLTQLDLYPQGVIAVESSGLCHVLDPQTLEPRFQQSAPGVNKLVFAFADVLLGGKTSVTGFAAPLLQINRRTGETVPIQDPSLFIYDLLYSEADAAVYSLAVERRDDRLYTILKVHTGFNFERSRSLYEFRGEDLGATVVADSSGRVYSSLGFDTVRVWSGGRAQAFQASGGLPRRLYVHGARLYSLNRDCSVSVWDLERKSWLMDITLLTGGGWVAVAADGRTMGSEGTERLFSRSRP